MATPPPPQVWGAVQVPQSTTLPQPGPPHPSLVIPQSNPWAAQVFGVHSGTPQRLGRPPPPHCWHVGQPPQSRGPPQPSVTVPQSKPCSAQVSATQPPLEELDVDEDVDVDDPPVEELVALVAGAPPVPPTPVEEEPEVLVEPAELLVELLPCPTSTVLEHARRPSEARRRRLGEDIRLRGEYAAQETGARIEYPGGMKPARPLRPVLLLLAIAACAPGAPPPPVVVTVPAAEHPPEPLPAPRPAAFVPLPHSVRDGRRFGNKSRALLVTEIQGIESIFSVTPPESRDRPVIAHRLAQGYGELEHVAEVDRAGAPAGSDQAVRADKIAAAARMAGAKYHRLLAQKYPQWCLAPQQSCADEALYYAALSYERARQLDDARKLYLDLLQGWPQSRFTPLAYLAFGELFLEESQRDRSRLPLAEASYAEVLEYPPEGSSVYGYAEYRLGQVFLLKGDGARARGHLQKAAEHAQASGDATLGALVQELMPEATRPPAAVAN